MPIFPWRISHDGHSFGVESLPPPRILYHINGANFEAEWSQLPISWIICHKMIWYNYMYHIDREINVSPTLEAWTTPVSQPFLFYSDPSFLTVYTTAQCTWQELNVDTNMDTDDLSGWTPVGEKLTSSTRSFRRVVLATLCNHVLFILVEKSYSWNISFSGSSLFHSKVPVESLVPRQAPPPPT